MKAKPGRVKLLLLAMTVAASAAGAATIEVADGAVKVAQDGQCSLIEALENANGDATHADCTAGEDGLDTLLLAAGSVYTLTDVHNSTGSGASGGPNGLPSISTQIVLQGRGATIERFQDDETPEFRLLHVDDTGNLTVEELFLRNGRAFSTDSWKYGGGIVNTGALTVIRSILSDNWADGGGGGIANFGVATISHSMLSGNSARFGGGIANHGAAAILSSTLSGNSTPSSGGGISNFSAFSLTVVNSTLTGNAAGAVGGGVANNRGIPTLLNSTLRGNSAGHSAGGIYTEEDPLILSNTIVADSIGVDCTATSGEGPIELGFSGVSLIEDGSCGCTVPSCISGDPMLGELVDNGGFTPTHALLAGSIAIDKADDAECPDVDQRGVLRGIDGVGDGSDEDLDGGCDIGAFEAGGPVAGALVVDPEPVDSDGNGVFEPQERVVVAPTWQNAGVVTRSLAGKASDFAGPTGPAYEIVGENADYGELAPAEEASCQDTGLCYEMEVDLADGGRPATHWDATFEETLTDEPAKTWTLHIGDSFTDVPRTSPFYRSIETLLHRSITAGCGNDEYCPANTVTRMATALLVLKASGLFLTPRACEQGEELFHDVPYDSPFCPWIEELASRGVIVGCGGGNYCPAAPVTRAQMAVFLLRTLLGTGYDPPECAGLFADVPCPSPFADWVEDLYARGITAGCGTDPLEYCPASSFTRGQMSVFLSKTFSLTLYGP